MRKTMTWILSLAALYGAICLMFFLAQNHLVYFPSDVIRLTPADVGMAYDEVSVATEDGVRITGWAVPGPAARRAVAPAAAAPQAAASTAPDEARNPHAAASTATTAGAASPWILYCHGNGGNIAGRLATFRILRHAGCSVLMFDYRGYGRSEGSPYEEGLYRDAEAMWRYLTETRGVAPSDIIVWGESLGGGVATWLAEKHAPRALVLQSTFTSVPDVGAPVYWWLPVRPLARNVFPSATRMARITCPVLHMHAPDDDLIPYPIGRRLYEAGHAPHTWLDIVGGHNGGLEAQSPEVLSQIATFLHAPPR